MHPWMFVAFGREIRFYGLGYALTLIIGANLAAWLLRKRGLNGDKLWDGLIWFIPAGFLGARLGYVLTNLNDYIGRGWEWLRIDHGGLSFHGGIIGAFIAMAIFYRKGSPTLMQVCDASSIPVAIGIMLVRVGNFMNGDITGYRWEGPWAMNFPYDELHNVKYLGPGNYELDPTIILRHPTEIYGFIVGLLLLLVLIHAWRRRMYDGFVLLQLAFWYSLIRSVIEEPFRLVPHLFIDFKIESLGFGGVTTTQWASLLIIIFAVIAMHIMKRKHDARQAALANVQGKSRTKSDSTTESRNASKKRKR